MHITHIGMDNWNPEFLAFVSREALSESKKEACERQKKIIEEAKTVETFANAPPAAQVVRDRTNLKTSLEVIKTFHQLASFVRESEAKLSFWGSRYVTFASCYGMLPLDALAERMIAIVKSKGFEYSVEDRALGKCLADRISLLYDQNDAQIRGAGLFTKLLAFISSFSLFNPRFTTSHTRWNWVEADQTEFTSCSGMGYKHIFDFYTSKQYKEMFGVEVPRHDAKRFEFPDAMQGPTLFSAS